MSSIAIDFSGVDNAVIDELCQGRHMRVLQQIEESKENQAAAAREGGEHRSIDGIGRLRMNIDPLYFHFWGKKLGYQCWNDPQFLREFERDNPEVRVKCGGTKLQVGYRAGLVNYPPAKKFHKSYGP
jgi:hypothetical protein